VSKFIHFSNAQQIKTNELKIQLFIDDLKKNPKIQDWQIAQTGNSGDSILNYEYCPPLYIFLQLLIFPWSRFLLT
jgi:hypothetical protein